MGAFSYLAASVPARMANFGAAVALPILAIQQFDDVTIGGLLVAATLGPSVLAAPLAGVILDRARRPGSVIAGAGLITATALATASLIGPIPLPVVLLTLVAAGAATPFYMGGLSSFIISVVPDVRRAFAYDALSYNASAVAGPAVVAVCASFLPAHVSLIVLAAAAALGSACVRAIGLRPHAQARSSPFEAIKAGLQRISGHRQLALVTASYSLSQLGQGALAVAAVALSLERAGSPSEGAALVTSFALGSLLGAIFETVCPTRRRPHVVMTASFFATGLLTLAAALDTGTVWTSIAIGLAGIFTAPATAAMLFLRNRHSPPHLRSQIFTVSAGLGGTASATGVALAASFSGFTGGTMSVVAIGLVWVASATLMIAYQEDPACL
ncbi:MFS transporter [Pseudarthrobacter sp. NPDC055928]|uniref:MFS transporter n=1 Tax=Pseudarthrobacter sp. NPDC055928 TaxID=3345661 RepID=UPI0035DA451C